MNGVRMLIFGDMLPFGRLHKLSTTHGDEDRRRHPDRPKKGYAMTDVEFNRKVTKACAWSGPVMVLMFLIGVVPLAGFFAPPTPGTLSAQQITDYYREHLFGIRLGCFIIFLGSALFLTFGISITEVTRFKGLGGPILGRVQTASVAVCTFDIFLIPIFWGVATYRAETTAPEVLQSWNDAAWMGILFGVPPFSLWCVAIALAILRDTEGETGMPRWSAYLNIWCAIFFVPAMLMIFFKTGPFAQNGIFAFWIPVGVFFFWIVSMTVLVNKAIDKQSSQDPERAKELVP